MRFSFLLCLQLAAAMMAITLATSHAVNAGAVEANGATYNAGAAAASSSSSSNVQLKYYVEAYCARCIDVLTNSLVDAMRRVGDIVDLEVIPFGNGSENGGVITCQHGAKECHANTLQGCAMVHYPKTKQWFGFIVCMEKQTDPLHAAKWCAGKHKIDFNKIEACAMGDEGKKVLMSSARKTLDLQPPNKYVPWLTVNSRPFEDPENVVAAVCSQYMGPNKDKYCSDQHRYQN